MVRFVQSFESTDLAEMHKRINDWVSPNWRKFTLVQVSLCWVADRATYAAMVLYEMPWGDDDDDTEDDVEQEESEEAEDIEDESLDGDRADGDSSGGDSSGGGSSLNGNSA